MVSINWSALCRGAKTAARSAAEAAAAGALAGGAAVALWGRGPELATGLGCAWLASSVSAVWLMAAREAGGTKAFWWAFGGGMALRLAALLGLMAYSLRRTDWSQAGLLLAYAFGVLGFLLLEYRRIRL